MTSLAAENPTEAQATTTQAAPPAPAEKTAGELTGTLLGGQQDANTPDQGKAGEAKPAEAKRAPEKYDFKSPVEDSVLDTRVLEAFGEVARELDLTQESAQKVIDKLAPVMQARADESFAEARAQWRQAAVSDREFGGDKLAENLKVANKALDRFGTPELRALLDESGAGDHAEWIRFFYRVGKAISNEDAIVTGAQGEAARPPEDPVQKLAATYRRRA